jgi:hypothetical protein
MDSEEIEKNVIDELIAKEPLSASEVELLEAWIFFNEHPYLRIRFVRIILVLLATVGAISSIGVFTILLFKIA